MIYSAKDVKSDKWKIVLLDVVEKLKESFLLACIFLIPNLNLYWNKFVETSGLSDRNFFVISISSLHSLLYFGTFFFFLACEKFNLLQK